MVFANVWICILSDLGPIRSGDSDLGPIWSCDSGLGLIRSRDHGENDAVWPRIPIKRADKVRSVCIFLIFNYKYY